MWGEEERRERTLCPELNECPAQNTKQLQDVIQSWSLGLLGAGLKMESGFLGAGLKMEKAPDGKGGGQNHIHPGL